MQRTESRLVPLVVLLAGALLLPAQAGTPNPPAVAPLVTEQAAPADGAPLPALAPIDTLGSQPAVINNPDLATPAPMPTLQPAAAPTDDLWERIRLGFRLDDLNNPLVQQHERMYTRHPEYLQRVIERSRRYLYFIVSEVERRGMPTEVALLPIVESAFDPKAESFARASGMWQFIPSTGQRYGLERTWWYDGRRDVMAATYAALDYLQDLYNLFGDWHLALAAYNWGEGGVGRAVAKSRAKGLEGDFDSIKKPRETENYVPKLIAIRNIIANPSAYGVTVPAVPNRPYFQPVSTGRHIDVRLAAKLAETTVEEVLKLNPGLIRPVFAHKDDRKLLLPVEKVQTFEQNLQQYDKPLLSWQPYVTKRGESLQSIAERFEIALAELREINKLGKDQTARGQTILVPILPDVDPTPRQDLATLMAASQQARQQEVDAEAPREPAQRPNKAAVYRVARGDSIFSIARRHDISVAELKRQNGLSSNRLKQGQELRIVSADARGESASRAKPARAVKTYVVRRGDSLDIIARRHDVSVADLKRWNQGAGRVLKVGLKLEIRNDS
ncbi:LysM peptidoglycan-binding domain-containing protein [Chitinimonas lacunae]|uniref:LysM peptidoglycan-binding domain-containing protein n=1 Tax=Chitinimonas lacunae TaxID=1963018 RepID=A0ABV8MSS4_9NEIS